MFKKIYKFVFKAEKYTKKYNKNAQNPFLKRNFEYNPYKNLYEQTYIWIEKPDIC